ncbi:GNAT family N-acetyltransferase [Solihabitans fulvus]|uniref:GNAT family N-acetyltransferase n=2 Tax=Solihabitans fulvus TaxID=1892852 RepID=A0A5B2WK21_9PSEU|nr:GNAT family N-acetyltransferase [Solihabitans fulvus]
MWFRQTTGEYRSGVGDSNRSEFRALAHTGAPIGLLAFDTDTDADATDAEAVGWVALAPRGDYSRLERAQVARPIDPDEDLTGVWSVTCFFVHRKARGGGVAAQLLDAAVRWAADRGARTVEGYPVDTDGERRTSSDLYHGTLRMFVDAGFELVDRRGTRRALVRRTVP